ncbi:ABC transporter substrate-binding protein [Pseudoduganella sp. UC29_71]|uniref:ABC transporter substrate-binding protein n=1 Tax=Pseudoduganella sp. UC29_71 TaxID=3350174 RepID=UPI003672951D
MNKLRRALLAGALLAAAGAPALAAAPLVIGFAQAGGDSAWRNANSASIKAAAALDGITLKFTDAGPGPDSQARQIAALRSFIAQKVDLIAFAPSADAGWTAVLREAKAAGIPVIVTGHALAPAEIDLYAAFLGSDYAEQGRRAGRWLAARAAAPGAAPHIAALHGPASGIAAPRSAELHSATELRIAELQGAPDAPATLARSKGFAQAIAAHPRLRLMQTQSGASSRAGGRQAMAAWLKAGQRIDALYAHSDELALGAIDAIEEAGLKPGRDVVVISIGGSRGAFEAMAAGKLSATVESSPLLGPQLMELARDVAAGRRVPKWVATAEALFPAGAAADELARRRY